MVCSKVLGKASGATELRKSPLNHPALWQHLKPFGVVASLDDLERPFPDLAQRLAQLIADLATTGEDAPETRIWPARAARHHGPALQRGQRRHQPAGHPQQP